LDKNKKKFLSLIKNRRKIEFSAYQSGFLTGKRFSPLFKPKNQYQVLTFILKISLILEKQIAALLLEACSYHRGKVCSFPRRLAAQA